jgi:hypothetical protein
MPRGLWLPRNTGSLSAPITKPPRDAWAAWIGPETLISQVRGTAPFLEPRLPATEPGRLIEFGYSPTGFLRILANWENILRPNLNPEEQLQDYFAFCLACHDATVATFVPTDVDTKIRGIVWRESRDPNVLRRFPTGQFQAADAPSMGSSQAGRFRLLRSPSVSQRVLAQHAPAEIQPLFGLRFPHPSMATSRSCGSLPDCQHRDL